VVPAVVLGVALLLIVYRLDGTDVTVDVRSYTFGMCAVAALLVLGDVLAGLTRRASRRRALAGLPGMLVVVAATSLAWTQWFAGDVDGTPLFWGAVTMAAVGVVVGATKLRNRRRPA
jgi:Na+/proline symporter